MVRCLCCDGCKKVDNEVINKVQSKAAHLLEILAKAVSKHGVRLIDDKELHIADGDIAGRHLRQQVARCRDYDVHRAAEVPLLCARPAWPRAAFVPIKDVRSRAKAEQGRSGHATAATSRATRPARRRTPWRNQHRVRVICLRRGGQTPSHGYLEAGTGHSLTDRYLQGRLLMGFMGQGS